MADVPARWRGGIVCGYDTSFGCFLQPRCYNSKKGGLEQVIKNLLMDLGNVTLSYDPVKMTEPWVDGEADRDAIIRALFGHPDWGRGDDGSLTEEEIFRNARGRLPERLHPALSNIRVHWPEPDAASGRGGVSAEHEGARHEAVRAVQCARPLCAIQGRHPDSEAL
jgi:hypothetical protein